MTSHGTKEALDGFGVRWIMTYHDYLPFYAAEPDTSFVHEIEGKIYGTANDDGDQAGIVIGTIDGLIVNAAEVNDGHDALWEVCDAHSQELTNVHGVLYDANDELKPPFYDFFTAHLIHLQSVSIDEKYRGLGLGLAAVWRLLALAGTETLVTLVPSPLLDDDADSAKAADAVRSLERYWRLLGFRPVRGRIGDGQRLFAKHSGEVLEELDNVLEAYNRRSQLQKGKVSRGR